MSIKRFDDPAPAPETPEPKPERKSQFSPFNTGKTDDIKTRNFGQKAWSASGATGGKYTNNEELADALMVQATEAYKKVEEFVTLYERAARNPTRENVKKYSDAINGVIADKNQSANVMSVLVATLVSLLLNQSKK